jgi:hypothetical protein
VRRGIGGHRLLQALRTHIGPVPLDVFDAGVSAIFAEHSAPPVRDLSKAWPQGVLFFVVGQNQESAVFIVEWVRTHSTSLDTGIVCGFMTSVLYCRNSNKIAGSAESPNNYSLDCVV